MKGLGWRENTFKKVAVRKAKAEVKEASEHDHQVVVVKWFEIQYRALAPMIFSCPSGVMIGGKNKFGIIKKMKLEGWKSGIPDLMIAVPRGAYHGLFIEMKSQSKTARASKEQLEYIDRFNEQGYLAVICKGSDEAINVIKTYMGKKTICH